MISSFLAQFAHADDQHTESTSEFVHLITEWYIAIPIFFGLVMLLVYILHGAKILSVPAIINIVLAVFFLAGVLTFSLVPALSVICISLGIFGALLIVLSSLAH